MITVRGDRYIVNSYPLQLYCITSLHPVGLSPGNLLAQGLDERYTLYDVNLLPP